MSIFVARIVQLFVVGSIDLQAQSDSIVRRSVPLYCKSRQNVEVVFALRIRRRLIAHNHAAGCLVGHSSLQIQRLEWTPLDVDQFLLKLGHFEDLVDFDGGF